MAIEFGQMVVDQITGFAGRVTGVAHYLSGYSQALVAPKVGDDGAFRDPQWFDVQRLMPDASAGVVVLDNGATPGADGTAPKR